MKIRNAKIEDKKELKEILIQAQELHYNNRPDIFRKMTPKEVEKEIMEVLENKERKIIVVANENDKVCGLVIFKIKEIKNNTNLKDARILHIGKIVVDEKCRRKGIGKLMMKEINKISKKLKCDRIELNCWSFNEEAIEFYKAQGMKIQRLNFEMEG